MNDNLKPGATIGVGTDDSVSQVLARTDLSTIAPLHVVSLTGAVDGYVILSKNLGEAPASDQFAVSVIPSSIVASTAVLAEALRRDRWSKLCSNLLVE